MNGIFALGTNSIIQFIVALLMLCFVVVLCYFATRFIANYQKGIVGKGNIEVIEAKSISSNKMIEIVRIGSEYYALGVSKDNISLIAKLDKDTILISEPEPSKIGESFSQILDKVKGIKKTKDE